MKKPSKNRRTLNDLIVSLNKPAYLIIITTYILFLCALLWILTPDNDYLIIPEYEHNTYSEDINPQVTIFANRSFNDDGEMRLRYDVTARLYTRRDEEGSFPRLLVERFQLSALTTTNKMYYFTEQTGNKTSSISHSYSMDNTYEERIPKIFFVRLEYEDINGDKQIETTREDVMLEMPNQSKFSRNNRILQEDDTSMITFQMIANNLEDRYNTSMRIVVHDYDKRYHIDMQTWIVTDDGEVLPFIGVYGFSDQRNAYHQSNRPVPHLLNPKYIFCQLVYYVDGEPTQTINYREYFDQLPTTFTQAPPAIDDDIIGVDPSGLTKIELAIIIIGSLLIIIGIGGVYYFVIERKKAAMQDLKNK